MYLPVDAQAQVAIGDKVTGVNTVLARLPLQAPEAAAPTETPPPAAAQTETPVSAQTVSTQTAPVQTVSEVAQSEIEAAADKVRNAVEQSLKD